MIRRLVRWLRRRRKPEPPAWWAPEHVRVEQGILSKRPEYASDYARYRLRRNTHRLEKALNMPDRDTRFATDYIQTMVNDFQLLLAREGYVEANGDEVAYIQRALNEYFSAVAPGQDEGIDAARAHYAGLDRPAVPERPPAEPAGAPGAAFDVLRLTFNRRQSVRRFLDRPVPPELIDECLALSLRAPSACNRQSFRYHVLTSPEKTAEFRHISIGLAGFSKHLPCVILAVGELRAFDRPSDRHLPYIDASLATMLLLTALDAKGVGACVVNWLDDETYQRGAERLLGLDADQFVVLAVVCGYPDPDAHVPYASCRKPLDSMRVRVE